ncbi:hypothetical protein L1987_26034 [Smallanthus sonchifolius]|uniref:Uncharacterized protein n=1 Tax=Smallanthus sonchifolius TaxID=185202 RepID=A0ACB9I9N0_9ASTR|nr:hypothetical protein L1987_26034 [Smallanthus sonchifolius]
MKREVWDCGSSLYDSFELKSLQHQLNAAISARTMSMPHLSHHRQPPPTAKKHSRISRSLHKILRSVFRTKHSHHITSTDEAFYVYDTDTSSALSTIPEVPELKLPEFDGLSPEMRSLVTRTRSDRFMSTTSLGISCV